MPNVILKRISAISRNGIMEDMHMKEKYETKIDELVFVAQNFIGYLSSKSR